VLVNDTILEAVRRYWDVVRTRESLDLQRRSLEQAEASYQRDKRALELGALSPLDIYRSESQVASRRFAVIQAEYALKLSEDQFRFVIGAEKDQYIRALDLDLTERPEPLGELPTTDAATTLEQALSRRPELEALREAMANDEANIRLAHNNLLPDLRLSGVYLTSGLAGDRRAVQTGLTDSLDQVFRSTYPTYGMGLTLTLPVRNRAAEANLGDALVSKSRDVLSDRYFREQITLEVTNAVHNLENGKLSMAAAKSSVELAQKNLAAEQRKYELGTQTIFFVLEAQTELAQAELSLVQAQIAYQNSLAMIDHATANLSDRYRVNISELTR
jgi:outer membrane protein TolC